MNNKSRSYSFRSPKIICNTSLKNSSEKGLQDGWTRVTFIMRQEHVQQIKKLAKKNRKTIKKYIHLALTSYLSHKEIVQIPTRI